MSPLTIRLMFAARLDHLGARWRRAKGKLGWPQPWLREFAEYLGDARLLPEEFWVRYTLKRLAAAEDLATPHTEATALDFYRRSDYLLWRQVVHRRHSQWRRVLVTMPRADGNLLEFGSGIAPVSAWCAPRRPNWDFWPQDVVGSPHHTYGLWRLRDRLQWADAFEVITALDVFEHLADPYGEAKRLLDRLAPGGILHWNFVASSDRRDLDLATPGDRARTLHLLNALPLLWAGPGHRVSRLGAR